MKNRGKRLLRALAAGMLSLAVLGGLGAVAEGVPFVQTFGGTGRDVVYDALPLSDGTLLLCCNTQEGRDGRPQSPERESLAWFLCLNPDGSVAWEKVFGDPGFDNVVCRPLETAEGNIATWFHTSQSQSGGYVCRKIFTLAGEPVAESERTVNWPDMYPAGEGYVVCEWKEQGPQTFDFMTPEGKVLWSVPTEQVLDTRDVVPVKEGFVFVGRSRGASESPAVCLMEKGGRVVWRTELREYPWGLLQKAHPTRDGGIITVGVAGEVPNEQFTQKRVGVVAKWNNRGGLEWTYAMPVDNSGKVAPFWDVAETSGGYLAIYPVENNSRIGYVLLDGQGREQGKTVGERKDSYLSAELLNFAGHVWLYDSVEGNGPFDVLVMKLDVNALFK